MSEFEEECEKRGILLAVLAPKSPKLNGYFERLNGTWHSDFCDLFDLPTSLQELRPMLNDFTDSDNWDRPHDGIGLQTPPTFSRRLRYPSEPFPVSNVLN
ncbi:MAG: transposase [Myxococcaceae bacterium]|nr:transposase [Myxococcaceae bacterium]